jgi:hypothetical protein
MKDTATIERQIRRGIEQYRELIIYLHPNGMCHGYMVIGTKKDYNSLQPSGGMWEYTTHSSPSVWTSGRRGRRKMDGACG